MVFSVVINDVIYFFIDNWFYIFYFKMWIYDSNVKFYII